MPTDGERGSGLISTTFGLGVFLIMVFFAVQVSLSLYATSVATAVAQDLARDIALLGRRPDATRVDRATRQAAARLAGMQGELTIVRDPGRGCAADEVVCVQVHARAPRFLNDPVGLENVDRLVRVRIEAEVR
jgi:Flp pilus assembly protein TadG